MSTLRYKIIITPRYDQKFRWLGDTITQDDLRFAQRRFNNMLSTRYRAPERCFATTKTDEYGNQSIIIDVYDLKMPFYQLKRIIYNRMPSTFQPYCAVIVSLKNISGRKIKYYIEGLVAANDYNPSDAAPEFIYPIIKNTIKENISLPTEQVDSTPFSIY